MRKKLIELSEYATELTITNSFLGAVNNLLYIEEIFTEKKILIPNQFFNYLSQLAFSIELGLKNIIKITSKVWKSHDLEELFIEADKETNNTLSKKFFFTNDQNGFKYEFMNLIKDTKNLFEEARYCYGKSLMHFIGDKYFTDKGFIEFEIICKDNKPFIMLRLFLNELGEYHNFVHTNSLKNINLEDDIKNNQLTEIIKKKLEIQKNITLIEKQHE